jgi:hypothetical protein
VKDRALCHYDVTERRVYLPGRPAWQAAWRDGAAENWSGRLDSNQRPPAPKAGHAKACKPFERSEMRVRRVRGARAEACAVAPHCKPRIVAATMTLNQIAQRVE